MINTPIEFISIVPYNPLISKCQIKVCWVGDTPNRNKSIITKDVAKRLANSLPGSPIVGYYNEETEDFEGHNKIIEIKNGHFKLKPTTQPYGFVDLNAKVWFQFFVDKDGVTREYMVTEGWLWTGQFPECQRIIDEGNNQSMELSEYFLDAYWTKDRNGNKQFFIINEAIMSKLCILGEDVEPAFEGAEITAPKIEFSFEDDFKVRMFSMMEEIKNILEKGGQRPMFTEYAVEIGDRLWSAIYSYLEEKYPNEDGYGSIYGIRAIYEESGNKFVILNEKSSQKLFRVDFVITEEDEFNFSETLVEVEEAYIPTGKIQFSVEDIEAFETARYAEPAAEPTDPEPVVDPEPETEPAPAPEFEEEKCPECGKPVAECECDKPAQYVLDEIPEYVELRTNYEALQASFNTLTSEHEELKTSYAALEEFKAGIDKKEKETMIASFYMLSDEDKKDVVDNIDTYSLDEIEAKLSILCVRNKVNFNLEDDNKNDSAPTVYNLDSVENDSNVPAWVKALEAMNN